MKILVITSKKRVERFTSFEELPENFEFVWAGYDKSVDEMVQMAPDAQAILADAISPVPGELIERLPKLKIIHSEGVGYEGVDLEAAKRHHIYVCNNRGANAHAVAEQAVLLMLAVLKRLVRGDRMTREGTQIEAKTGWIMEGIPELGSKSVGIIGMGDIGKQTALLCRAFGCSVAYHSRHQLNSAEEKQYGVACKSLEELLRTSDIISLHLPSNAQTRGFMNLDRMKQMKRGAILINTARGEVVCNENLIFALQEGLIGGAGLDTVAPEPVLLDNPLLNLPESIADKITFSPHIGGVTEQTFRKIYKTIWANMLAVEEGSEPINIVSQ